MTFREGFVEADGFRIRYVEAGDGPPLIHLHGAGGMRLTPMHDLLSQTHRTIVFEMPGFGASAENTRSETIADLADTMAQAIAALRIDRFDLLATSFGAKVALTLASTHPDRVIALVLEGPAAIRPEGSIPPIGIPRLYAHPERVPPMTMPDPATMAKQRALTGRLRGPDRDAAFEARLTALAIPVLVLFGTLDHVIPSSMGRFYKQLIPNCQLVFVYDAGHEIGTERPEAFVDVVADFLTRHEAFAINRTETVIHP